MIVLFGYVIPAAPKLPEWVFDDEDAGICEDCGEPMEWNDPSCGDPECDCQHYSPRVHIATGYSSCGTEGL